MDDLAERVVKVIAKELVIKGPIADMNLDATLDDLGADSLEAIGVMMALEDEFGIEIPDEHIQRISVIRQAIEYIRARIEGGPLPEFAPQADDPITAGIRGI